MIIRDCKMARSLKIVFGIFFAFLGVGLAIIGITFLPLIGLLLSGIAFVVSVLFLLSPRDEACYLQR